MTHEEMDALLAGLPCALDVAQRCLAEEYLAAHPALGANEAECVVRLMSWAAENWPAGTVLGDIARLPVVQVHSEDFADLCRAKAGWDQGRAKMAETEARLREAEGRAERAETVIKQSIDALGGDYAPEQIPNGIKQALALIEWYLLERLAAALGVEAEKLIASTTIPDTENSK